MCENLKQRLCIFLVCIAAGTFFSLGAQDRGLSVIAREITGSPNFEVGRQYAVIIGIDRYQNWMPLKKAVSEARDIKNVLSENYYIDEFIELYDDDATASNIRKLFSQTLPARLGIHDSLLVFYAGHGHLDDSKSGFWIPIDGGTDILTQDRWIPNAQLRNYLGQLKVQRLLVMADACFSGDLLNTSRSATPTVDSAYFKRALQLTSRQVLSSGASETVPDESEFARQLLSYLERNTEPMIDALSIFERIRKGMTQTLPLFGTLPGNENGASYILFRKQSQAAVLAPTVAKEPTEEKFRVSVLGPVPGMQVLVDGKELGVTPLDTSLPKGVYTIRLTHADWESWQGTVQPDPSGLAQISPNMTHSVSWQISDLQKQQAGLEQKLGLAQKPQKTWATAGTVGWISGGLGAAASVAGYFICSSARTVYDAATTASEATAARARVDMGNALFQVGILGGGTGLLTGIVSLFLKPDTKTLEQDIQVIKIKIQNLGASK